jgi:hypothetical protein
MSTPASASAATPAAATALDLDQIAVVGRLRFKRSNQRWKRFGRSRKRRDAADDHRKSESIPQKIPPVHGHRPLRCPSRLRPAG